MGQPPMRSSWIDVSVPIRTGMVSWPGDPPPRISRILDLKEGDPCTVSFLALTAHTGTHVDAPAHYISGGSTMDGFSSETWVGKARVIGIADPKSVTVRELSHYRIRRGERILFKTRNSPQCWRTARFVKSYVSVSPEAARYLADRAVRLVGIDYLSVAGMGADAEQTHTILLGAGVWILEGINLTEVRPGAVEMICLPLRISGGDGAPARVLLRQR